MAVRTALTCKTAFNCTTYQTNSTTVLVAVTDRVGMVGFKNSFDFNGKWKAWI